MLSPNTIINDFSPDIEGNSIFTSELLKVQTSLELNIFVKSIINKCTLYQDVYNTNNIDEIIHLISIDAFNIIENALKLKNIIFNHNTFQRMNKNKNNLPFFNNIMASAILIYISNCGDNNNHISLGNNIDVSYVRGRLIDFSIMGPGYWGDSDWGLERTIRNSINKVPVVFASAIERLGIFLSKAQFLTEWKITNPLSTQAELMLYANSCLEKPKNIIRNPYSTDLSQIKFRSSMNMCPTTTTTMGIPMILGQNFFQPNMIAPPLPVIQQQPIELNLVRIPLQDPTIIHQEISGPYSQMTNMVQFRKAAKNINSLFNGYSANNGSRNRLIGLPGLPSPIPDPQDHMALLNDDSLVIMSSKCPSTELEAIDIMSTDSQDPYFSFLNLTTRTTRTSSFPMSDTESDTASKDSDGKNSEMMCKSNIVRRGRKLTEKQCAPSFKMHAKGIQVTQHRSFRVQLNKTKNSSNKFTKNVNDFTEALWLFEIAVLICDQPTKLNTLLKSGNYDFLLMNNYVKNSTDYRALLGDNILKLHSKKILKNEQADLAISIFGNLANDSVRDDAVDPVDLANLLSLKG